jgi:hypothetical protein
MEIFKLDSEGENKMFRVDKNGCSIVSPDSIEAIAKKVLELKESQSRLSSTHALCEVYDHRLEMLAKERDELLQMLRCAADDYYKKRTGFITEDDIFIYIESLRLRARKEF